MRVYLTFDVEVWCNDWARLDERFPSAFERYVFGRSARGEYALPKTLELLDQHGLRGVFFVEPLFSARFGIEHLAVITRLISQAGQDVQLHLHTEWVDELPTPPIADHHHKRQHLSYHTLDEQRTLLDFGAGLLQQAGMDRPTAFRAGSFACNHNTFRALADCGIQVDSSLNACAEVSAPDLREAEVHEQPAWIESIYSVPVAVFEDGLGRLRSAQLNGSSFSELRRSLESAHARGHTDFVIVSHNFEMLKPGTSEPDPIVVRRFESLCRYLSTHREMYDVTSFQVPVQKVAPASRTRAAAGLPATLTRYAEQAWRRL